MAAYRDRATLQAKVGSSPPGTPEGPSLSAASTLPQGCGLSGFSLQGDFSGKYA